MEILKDDETGNVTNSKAHARSNPIDAASIVTVWLFGCSKKNNNKFRVEVRCQDGKHLVYSGFTFGMAGVGTLGLEWLFNLYNIPIGIGVLEGLIKEYTYKIEHVYGKQWILEFTGN